MGKKSEFKRGYITFSGIDIKAVLGDDYHSGIGTLQKIKYKITRSKQWDKDDHEGQIYNAYTDIWSWF